MTGDRGGESLVDRVYSRTAEKLVSSGRFSDAEAKVVCEILSNEGINADRLMEAIGGLEEGVDENP